MGIWECSSTVINSAPSCMPRSAQSNSFLPEPAQAKYRAGSLLSTEHISPPEVQDCILRARAAGDVLVDNHSGRMFSRIPTPLGVNERMSQPDALSEPVPKEQPQQPTGPADCVDHDTRTRNACAVCRRVAVGREGDRAAGRVHTTRPGLSQRATPFGYKGTSLDLGT